MITHKPIVYKFFCITIPGICVCTTLPICREAAMSVKIVRLLNELKGKVLNKSLLLNMQEQRGAYWVKKYEEVIKAFE